MNKLSCKPVSLSWEHIPCKLDVSSLIALRTGIPLRDAYNVLQRIKLKDQSSPRQFNIDLAVCAIIPQENGTVEVYGGAGSDEYYATWCIIIVPLTPDSAPEDLIGIDTWTVPEIQHLSFRTQT